MVWKDRLSGIFIIIFSGVTIYLAFKLPMGRAAKPGPGIFPLLLSVVIGFLALSLFLRTLRSKGEFGIEEIPTTKWRLVYLLGDLFLYVFLLRPLGFLISTWIFLILLNPIVKKKWIPVLLGSLFISAIFFFSFNYLLKVELPMGILAK
jgi:putative tricarboxylic transport membrane protein